MNEQHGTFPEPGTVRFKRLLPGPPERIWAYLTESDKKEQWLSAGDVEPKVGGKVTHNFYHQRLSKEEDPIPEKYADMEEGAHSAGTVTQYDPPRLLSYTWSEDDGDESEVTFELIPQDENKVLLILTHRKMGDNLDLLIGVGAGWHTHLSILSDCLNDKEPKGFWKVHMPLEDEYERILKSEN